MTDATAFNDTRPAAARVRVEFPLTRENLTAAFRKALNWNRPFAERPEDARYFGDAGGGLASAGASVRGFARSQHRLFMSGSNRISRTCWARHSAIRAFCQPARERVGGRLGEQPFEGPLKPGDAVGVVLVNGDLQLGATGTVTPRGR